MYQKGKKVFKKRNVLDTLENGVKKQEIQIKEKESEK
jgi:hypothetical protein